MSNLTLLPLVRVQDGVQVDEDWRLSIAFYLDDNVTPVDLSGLSFTLTINGLISLSSPSSNATITGPYNNIISFIVLANQKTTWATGIYSLSLTATDGFHTRELFAFSELTVGSAQTPRLSLVVTPDTTSTATAAAVSSALVDAFAALQPSAIVAALANLSPPQLSALTQALLSSLAVQGGTSSPVPTGQAFVNSSGYVVFAQ